MNLRSSLNLPWPDFVSQWCLGIAPMYSELDTGRALLILERLWSEQLDRLEASGKGLAYVNPVIHLGQVLVRCESLTGFSGVLERAKGGEGSARSELEFAAGLVRLGLVPDLEPHLGTKRLDTCVSFEGKQIFCEVISPERSDATQDAQAQMSALAQRLLDNNQGADIELLLSPNFDFTASGTLEERVRAAPISLQRHEILDVGAFVKFAAPLEPLVMPRLVADAPGPLLGTARMTNNSGSISQAVVRLPHADWRVARLLTAELHHFSKAEMNLLAIDVSRIAGGMKEWVKPVLDRFQPTRNRRIGSVVLFEKGGLVGPSVTMWPRWRVIRNPHAYLPISSGFLDLVQTLDSGPLPID